jgi:hypothetical protein
MSRKIDITEKLDFDSNPVLVILGQEFEVNADAEAMIRMMGVFGSGKSEIESVNEAIPILFGEKGMKKLFSIKKDGKKLNVKSLMTIIQEAMSLVLGEGDEKEQ